MLTAIHLPIALWLAVGVAYVGGDWLPDARRMEYVRFTGEWLVTYALIALGGGVLVAITMVSSKRSALTSRRSSRSGYCRAVPWAP